MLQLKNIVKTYVAGDTKQDALKGVSMNFRERIRVDSWTERFGKDNVA